MKLEYIISLIEKGESSTVQFKSRINDAYKIGTEIVAFCNNKGGTIIIGVDDKTGSINGLSFEEIQMSNQILANAATDNIKPSIYITTETYSINNHKIIVAQIPEGISKPYIDNKGIIWTKNGSDKRKVISREEISRLLQSGGNLFADEILIQNSTIDDIDKNKFLDFFIKNWGDTPENLEISYENALNNTMVIKHEKVTLGGLLFFGIRPQRYKPAFCIKAVSYFGNEIENTSYRDSEDIHGTIPEMFEKGLSFLKRNLKKTQQGQPFNSLGIIEIPEIALEEVLQNALIHRDYFINAPVRIFIFDDRVEIISPGKLPNSLTIDNIKFGSSIIRNNLLTTFCAKIMKYRGIGSGVRRTIKAYNNTDFQNSVENELFIVTFYRSADN
jgi:ATP-dependent DNA helicase RecG